MCDHSNDSYCAEYVPGVPFVMLHILESSTKRGGEVKHNQFVNEILVETIEMKAI